MDVRARLDEVLAEHGFDTAGRPDDTNLRDQLAMDSTALVDIAMAIERNLSVPIDGGRFVGIETIADMVLFVQRQMQVPGPMPPA